MSDDLAERRRIKALQRVDRDCAETIAEVVHRAELDRIAREIIASRRRHPANPRPFDWEAEA